MTTTITKITTKTNITTIIIIIATTITIITTTTITIITTTVVAEEIVAISFLSGAVMALEEITADATVGKPYRLVGTT